MGIYSLIYWNNRKTIDQKKNCQSTSLGNSLQRLSSRWLCYSKLLKFHRMQPDQCQLLQQQQCPHSLPGPSGGFQVTKGHGSRCRKAMPVIIVIQRTLKKDCVATSQVWETLFGGWTPHYPMRRNWADSTLLQGKESCSGNTQSFKEDNSFIQTDSKLSPFSLGNPMV